MGVWDKKLKHNFDRCPLCGRIFDKSMQIVYKWQQFLVCSKCGYKKKVGRRDYIRHTTAVYDSDENRLELESYARFVEEMRRKDICCYNAGCLDDDFDYCACGNCGKSCHDCTFKRIF